MRIALLLPLSGCALIDALGDSDRATPGDSGGPGDAGNAWVALHPLLGPRSSSHTAVVGSDIYAISGLTNRPTNERYATTTDSWSARTEVPIATGRSGIAAVGNFIYLSGGILANSNCTSRHQRYDTAGDSWSEVMMLPSTFCRHGTVTIGSSLWMTGGNIQNVFTYDTINDTYTFGTAAFPPPSVRQFPSVTAVGSKVYLLGGLDTSDTSIANVDVYDTVNDTWTPETPLPSRRDETGAVAVGDKIFVIGGRRDNGEILANVDILDTTTHQWTAGPPLPVALNNPGVAAIGNTIYVIGGSNESIEFDTLYTLTVD